MLARGDMVQNRFAKKFLFFLITLMIVFFSLLPFIWFFITSLKTEVEVTAIPPTLIPSWSLDFYRSGIEQYDLLHFVKNSMIISGATTAITLMSQAAFQRFHSRKPSCCVDVSADLDRRASVANPSGSRVA
jgi:multiple sugar transport system permease protein